MKKVKKKPVKLPWRDNEHQVVPHNIKGLRQCLSKQNRKMKRRREQNLGFY